jgi:hypothetical protein
MYNYIVGEDNCEIAKEEKEKLKQEEKEKTKKACLSYSSRREMSPINLGIYMVNKLDKFDNNKGEWSVNDVYHTNGLIGITQLICEDDNKSLDINKDDILIVNPRWGDPIVMLETVLNSEEIGAHMGDLFTPKIESLEYWRNCDINIKNTSVLYGIYKDLNEIYCSDSLDESNYISSISGIQNVFNIYMFLEQLECICKRALKQQSKPFQENLVGKLKGKVIINKQIKYNLAKGRLDRNYCSYNKMSIDNIENRILKYALFLCKKWSIEKNNIFSEKIIYCENVLRGVPLVKVTRRDILGVKNNNAFKEYKKGIKLAAEIIDCNKFEFYGSKSEVKIRKVKPFFINMNLLFELYCGVIVEKALKKANLSQTVSLYGNENNHKYLFGNIDMGTIYGLPQGFQNEHIADIVIKECNKSNKLEGNQEHISVIDAKYSMFDEYTINRRGYTHQLLTYMLLFNAKSCGFIYPGSMKKKIVAKFVEAEKDVNLIKGIEQCGNRNSNINIILDITQFDGTTPIVVGLGENCDIHIAERKENNEYRISKNCCIEVDDTDKKLTIKNCDDKVLDLYDFELKTDRENKEKHSLIIEKRFRSHSIQDIEKKEVYSISLIDNKDTSNNEIFMIDYLAEQFNKLLE